MKRRNILLSTAVALATVTNVPTFADNMTLFPPRVLSPIETANFPNSPGIVPLPVTFKTAALVNTSLVGQPQPAGVARGNAVDAAVYSGYDGPAGQQLVPPPQPAPPLPTPGQEYQFKKSGDAVQAWATMTSNGVPYMMLKGFGQFAADGHVSWRTTLPLPSGQHNVYLKVTVPSTTVFGNYDSNGPGVYHLRAHADVLVNGHSVYFGEAIRFNEVDAIPVDPSCDFTNTHEKAMRMRTYGSKLAFPGDADGDINTAQPPSMQQTVVLYLGNFSSTESVDVQFILNAEAMIENKCCQKPSINNVKGELFCSAANAGFDYEPGSAPVFYVQ